MLNPDHPITGQMRRCIAALLLTALTACAPLEWHKAGTADEDILRDRDRCADDARNKAFQQRAPLRSPTPQIVVDPQGRIIASKPASPDTERFALEQDLMRKCMHDFGYELRQKPSTATP